MLPIDPLLPEICATLLRAGRAVLQAPPGAGKTTRVPLALMEHIEGKILMLEPRRIAARAAAERLAQGLPKGEVGYRMRGDSKPGRRIEVVTEGILTRMVQNDPELPGVGAVIFDEFHERSLNADLGLALVLEARAALRPDLKLLIMSATLDGAAVAELLDDAPILTSQGRSFPVEIRHLSRPLAARTRLAPAVADLVLEALRETEGGMLVFLPGEGEIRDVARRLAGKIAADVVIQPLYGALPFKAQQEAIRPLARGRKLVLATAIAETSLTIEDIRVVVDGGQARRARFDPGSGMSRLVTEKVTRAEATQRAGRAGRVAKGIAYRLWAKAEEGALAAFPPPEIAEADLTGLALELAQWGSSDLPFLTPPPEAALAEARDLLLRLDALDETGRITPHGARMAMLPLHPRLAHMQLLQGESAAYIAALLSDRDFVRGAGCDLTARLSALRGRYDGPGHLDVNSAQRVRKEAHRLGKMVKDITPIHVPNDAVAVALAFPDRIGLRRKGRDPRWLLSGGRGAVMEAEDKLAGARLLVAPTLDGGGREARIRLAIPISENDLRAIFPKQIQNVEICEWSRKEGRVLAKKRQMLGQICLEERNWNAPQDAVSRALCDGIRQIGLRFSPKAARLRQRVALAREAGHTLPDMSDEALLAGLENWLAPYLKGVSDTAGLKNLDIHDPLRAMLDWSAQQLLEQVAPGEFTTPLGRKIPISYEEDVPVISLRLQEMLGVTAHPHVGNAPIKVVLLSPAQRPIQITMDLPGFWASSYADLRKDMRAQYPKHLWPEDPTCADPTLRAKPRK